MRATCPDCGAQAHLSAFFAEDDGKRLAAVLAGMAPELGRATIQYLGLFKPAKTALRALRAARLAQELDALASAATVCRDERGGVRRPCSAAMWVAGIETMLQQRGGLSLPLENHNYLRAVVYGLADKADAAAESQREADAKLGRGASSGATKAATATESWLDNQLAWLSQQRTNDLLSEEDYQARVHEAYAKGGAAE